MSSEIPAASRVLVTGASAFLSSHIIHQLLCAGFNVRAAVRELPQADWMKEYFSHNFNQKFDGSNRLEIAVVPDMATAGAYDEAIKGCSGVVHVASVLTFNPDPNKVITPTVDGITNALTAAHRTPTMKRFVLTSSTAACTLPKANAPITLDEHTWNEESIAKAWAPPPYTAERARDVYGASKARQEQEMWKFVRENKPAFICNSLVTSALFGPLLAPGKQKPSTAGRVAGIFTTGLESVKGIPPHHAVDVRDAARLHVAALTDPKVQNQRIFAFADRYNWNEVLDIMRKVSPQHKFPENLAEPGQDLTTVVRKSEAEEILKRNFDVKGFIQLEEMITANVAHRVDRV